MATVLGGSRDRSEICPTTQPTPVAVGAVGRTTVSIWRPRAPTRSMTEGRRCPYQCARPLPDRTVESEGHDAEIRQSEYTGTSYSLREGIPIFPFSSIGCGHLGQTNRGGRLGGHGRGRRRKNQQRQRHWRSSSRGRTISRRADQYGPNVVQTRPEVIVRLSVVRSGTPC
jgi:hypothetical protein